MNLTRRIRKFELHGTDATGLVPHSEARFAFCEDKLFRLPAGENTGNIRIPLDVTDRVIANADHAEAEAGMAL